LLEAPLEVASASIAGEVVAAQARVQLGELFRRSEI
jgi:hypothetical protein